MNKLLLSLFALSPFLRADFAPQDWQFRTPIHLPTDSAIAQLTLNVSVCAHSNARLNDLRVVKDGAEIPYELQVSAGDREERNLPLEILNKAVVPGQGLQATIDLNGHPQHNRLRIATSQRNFKETLRLETSDDGLHWSLVRTEALIFDISRQDRTVSDLTAEYPTSTRRYLRLTVPGWHDPAFLESAWLSEVNQQHVIRDQVASLKPAVTQDLNAHTTAYTLFGFERQPFDELELSVGPDLFFRNVDVFTSDSGKDWTFAGATVITNRPDDVHLRFRIPEQWTANLKLAITNGDSPPVNVKSIALFSRRRTLRFASAAPGRYWLYSGNGAAHAPHYDLTAIVGSKATDAPALLGTPEANPEYQVPSKPWSDRNAHLLTGLVIAAAILMAIVTLRLLLRVRTA